MHISINTEEPLSDVDRQILAVLAGTVVLDAGTSGADERASKAAELASRAEAAAKPSKPAKAASKPAPKPKPEPVEEDADETQDENSDASGNHTLEDAIAIVTEMVSNGGAAKVKAALKKVGAPKVSAIDEDDIDVFIAALRK